MKKIKFGEIRNSVQLMYNTGLSSFLVENHPHQKCFQPSEPREIKAELKNHAYWGLGYEIGEGFYSIKPQNL